MTDIASNHFDVIIIGAGINGAGIARDASLRGLRVLLLDKDDIGCGTSSYSTRLIHGGLRYLEYGELGLVRESLRERETLLKIASHLVRPLPILIPIYQDMKRGRAKIRTGMFAYDLLSLDKSLPRHRVLTTEETLQRVPLLKSEGLLGSVIYYDAQVEFAERLVFENVVSAVENGASVLTHTQVHDFITEEDRVTAVKYQSDFESGTVSARFVVNAAGPWVDRVLESIGNPASAPLIGGTKGSHIVVAPFPGPGSEAIYVEAKTDGRPFFIIPWNEIYLIGTTDVRFERDPNEARAEDWEIDYLLNETNRLFRNANLGRVDILYTYSGVRPLPFTNENDEQGITRRHFIKRHPRLTNFVSIVGGKLTTYRGLAEECVDLLCEELEMDSVRCRTADLPLPGARDFEAFVDEFGKDRELSARAKSRLLRIYGSRAGEVVEFSRSTSSSGYLDAQQTTLFGEIAFSFEREFAKTLTDCFMRRTMIGLNADMGVELLDAAIKMATESAKWSDERVDQELADYRAFIRRRGM